MTAIVALAAGVAAGILAERRRHRCPDPNVGLLASLDQAQALAREWHREATRRARIARHWRTTAYDHAAVLAALGRVVAEGGTVDPRHPSQRQDDDR